MCIYILYYVLKLEVYPYLFYIYYINIAQTTKSCKRVILLCFAIFHYLFDVYIFFFDTRSRDGDLEVRRIINTLSKVGY